MSRPRTLATALDDPRILARARRIRAAARHRDEIAAETDRLAARAQHQRARAARLTVASNGRRKALRDAAECDALAVMLADAQQARPVGKIETAFGCRASRRAASLLSTITAESAR